MKKCIIFTPNFIVQNMKYFLIAGEASGDLHGSHLVTELKKCDPDAQFRIWGGDLMAQAAGCELVKHYRTYDYMGIMKVVKHDV